MRILCFELERDDQQGGPFHKGELVVFSLGGINQEALI
jgi:hypothetical protein